MPIEKYNSCQYFFQRNVNLNCIPSKIHELFGDDFKLHEKNTLERINNIKEFDKYRKK